MKTIMIKKIATTLTWAGLACSLLSSAFASAVTVDLLVLYDSYSKDYFSGEPETAMVSWINQINDAYRDSQVDIQLRLVGVRPNEEKGERMSETLTYLFKNPDVSALRNELGADYVSQLHRNAIGGIAWLNVHRDFANSVVGPDGGPLTMAHELGHGMGLDHDRAEGNGIGGTRYSYGVGYGVQFQFGDIMTNDGAYRAPTFARFSNPTIQCKGLPCGVPVGQPDEAYAALALQNVRYEISRFRPPHINGGSTDVATFYQDCNYGGGSAGLPVGKYTTAQLEALGIQDNDISSIKVQSGYTVTLYAGDNFEAYNISRTADDSCFDTAPFSRLTSSIVVAPTTATSSPNSSSSRSSSSSSTSSSSSSRSSSSSSTSSSSSNRSSSSSSITLVPTQCNWWGQIVPLCTTTTSGWGYENNASCVSVATCKSQPEPYGVIQSSSVSTFSALIQAENYDYMSGVLLESTTDIGGGQNIGWLDAGDWVSYSGAKSINIPVSGSYMVEFRVASQNGGGSFTFEKNGGSPIYATINVPSTGGWQSWTTLKATVNLTAGVQGFGIGIKSGGFNINWYRITKL